MLIYIGHATKGFDYKNLLYDPLESSDLNEKHKIILPHKESNEPISSESFIKKYNNDLIMIADLTVPSTGLGVELAWAREQDIQVIFIYQQGADVTNTPKYLWEKDGKAYIQIEYKDGNDLVTKLRQYFKNKNYSA